MVTRWIAVLLAPLVAVPVVAGASRPVHIRTTPAPADDACAHRPEVDANGWLIRPWGGMTPAPVATRAVAQSRALSAYAASEWSSTGGHPVAAFGLLRLPSGKDRAQWLVVVCDGTELPPVTVPPMGYPGTAPSPGPPQLGVQLVTVGATSGRIGGVEQTSRLSAAGRAAEYVHVPWHLVGRPTAASRHVRIRYPAAEPCATFDHVAVELKATTVDLRVWLRLLPGGPAHCAGKRQREAVVYLSETMVRQTLGHRRLRDAGDLDPGELY
ncbi:hypothetical protein acdb102_07340 [Acidothermaceae bacterium B102]|nr:hypothetical protein acdb102_07340 [Acidothermaceae bacterium B102]